MINLLNRLCLYLTAFVAFYLFYFSSATSTNNLNVTIVTDTIEFYSLYPESYAEVLKYSKEGSHRYYTLGGRKSGDILAAQSVKGASLQSMKNVGIRIEYPTSVLAPQINYVIIEVDQTSDFGRAYVVKGGLYQSSMTIIVEVYNSVAFRFNARFYGIY